MKYLVINLIKEVKEPCSENYKILMEEAEGDKINRNISRVHELEELIQLKCPYYPKQSTDLMQPLSKNQENFHRTRTNNPKIYMEQ